MQRQELGFERERESERAETCKREHENREAG